jgi:hypothetical protein
MTTTTKQPAAHPFKGARKAKPTKQHRPVIWENMLGTVYAASPEGEVRYFDYRWDEAREFAGITTDTPDLRLARPKQVTPYPVSYFRNSDGPRWNQLVLWARVTK